VQGKVLLTIVLCSLFAFTFYGCGATYNVEYAEDVREIKSVIDAYFNAFLAGDYYSALNCIHPASPFRQNFSIVFQQVSPLLADIYAMGCSTWSVIEIENVNIQGDTAFVTLKNLSICYYCSVYYYGCENVNELAGRIGMLKKYNGKWYIY